MPTITRKRRSEFVREKRRGLAKPTNRRFDEEICDNDTFMSFQSLSHLQLLINCEEAGYKKMITEGVGTDIVIAG
jgi:hypothetical protein